MGVRWPRSTGRRLLFLGVYGLFLWGLYWGAAKVYWRVHAGVPLQETPRVWDHYYPNLRQSGVLDAEMKLGDETVDVLMLGGSTIEHGWGNVEELLQAGLARALHRPVRIFNLATIAHTSRDSALKFSQVRDKPFDLVLVYDGFNDVRMNNCPPDIFRDDYTHCSWYRAMEARVKAGKVNLPQTLLEPIANLRDTIGQGGMERPEWAKFGCDVKTAEPLRNNLAEIVEGTEQAGGVPLLMTFAWHIPADYSREKFDRQELDYGPTFMSKPCGVEMWGLPECVGPAVETHNRVIRELAEEHPRAVFVDQARLMNGDPANFADPCHLTAQGCRTFVDNLLPAVVACFRTEGSK